MKVRTGDTVSIMTGKDKNKQGVVLKVFTKTNKVLVEGVNIVTRHIKKVGTNPGQIAKFEKPISVSNVMVICNQTKKPTRIGFVFIEEKGKTKKFRYSKKAVKELGKEPKDCIIK